MAFNGTGSNVTSLNAANISSGTLAVGRGGTGITSTGTAGNVLTSNGTAWVSEAIAAGGDYIMTAYTSPATWTKPAGLKAVKVTVIGAGGNGGNVPGPGNYGQGAGNGGGGGGAIRYLDAPAVPGPISVTVGTAPSKTSSFGPLVSATGGTNGANAGSVSPEATAAGGTGSSGTINVSGGTGFGRAGAGADIYDTGFSGAGAFAFGGFSIRGPFSGATLVTGTAGQLYGGGGTGAAKGASSASVTGGAGGSGIVIVEEFY